MAENDSTWMVAVGNARKRERHHCRAARYDHDRERSISKSYASLIWLVDLARLSPT